MDGPSKVDILGMTEGPVKLRFGGEGGSVELASTAPKGYQIIGLCGHAGQQLDALGVVMCAKP